MSEFYAEPELSAAQELILLRARIALYTTENAALRIEIDTLKDRAEKSAARVRQLEFEAGCSMMRFAQRSEEPVRMERIRPHDAPIDQSGGAKPGL